MLKNNGAWSKIPGWIGSFRYFPAYLKAICREWQAILWGESILGAIITTISFLVGNTPLFVIFSIAVVLAGFYAWCAEYRKSLPVFSISGFTFQRERTQSGEVLYIQLLPKCLGQLPVLGCKAYLIRILKKDNAASPWKETTQNEVCQLKWSASNQEQIVLEPRAERRIDVCISSEKDLRIFPAVFFLHNRSLNDLVMPGIFSFDIKVVCDGGSSVFVSLEVDFTGREWNKPACKLWNDLTNDRKRRDEPISVGEG